MIFNQQDEPITMLIGSRLRLDGVVKTSPGMSRRVHGGFDCMMKMFLTVFELLKSKTQDVRYLVIYTFVDGRFRSVMIQSCQWSFLSPVQEKELSN